MARSARKLKVGVTGASSDLGRLLLPLLEQDPRVGELVIFDSRKPEEVRATFRRVELSRPGGESAVIQALEQERPHVLYHLAFADTRVHRADIAHELEVMGSMNVLAGATRLRQASPTDGARLERLILASSTALYGARPSAPAWLTEAEPLAGCPHSRFINDKVEVERQFGAFASAHPEVATVVLRLAPLVGPVSDNPVTRLLRTGTIPSLMGFDPLWQALHESDAALALQRALVCESGAFNVAAEGVMPWSGVVRHAGGRIVPLPGPLLRAVASALEGLGRTAVPEALLSYLRYSVVADASRGAKALQFVPRFSMAEAVSSLQGARA